MPAITLLKEAGDGAPFLLGKKLAGTFLGLALILVGWGMRSAMIKGSNGKKSNT
jgi:hypothetical protein